MVVPLFWIYVVVELAAVVGLAATIGIGWTLLILLAAFVVGLSVAGSQIRRQLRRLRDGMTSAQGAVSDGALVALGTLLVVIPGLVTSVLGLLVLLPPTRAAARPVLTFLVARGVRRRAFPRYPGHGDYIDGEVINVEELKPPALP
ncbi:MAG: FxsA family protein [Mycolicibacterium sp.]|nr:FxsA family protein [Mycolicibacterium sp.]